MSMVQSISQRLPIFEVPMPSGEMLGIRASATAGDPALESIKLKGAFMRSQPDARLREVLLDAREMEWGRGDSMRITLTSEGDADGGLPEDFMYFAAIAADRAARGLFSPLSNRVIVLATSRNWFDGRLQGFDASLQHRCLEVLLDERHDFSDALILLPKAEGSSTASIHEAIRKKHPFAIVCELPDLSMLGGQLELHHQRRSAHVWFPVIGGEHRLLKLAVSSRRAQSPEGNAEVLVRGLSPQEVRKKEEVASMVKAMRQLDTNETDEWTTLFHFERGFEDRSWEFAAGIADRIARGREFPAKNRLIATGSVDETGNVNLPVDEIMKRKCELIQSEVEKGDRILLPFGWAQAVSPNFTAAVSSKGASIAFVGKMVP